MANQVVWNGLDEYRELLRQLPEACNVESGKYVEAAVNSAFVAVSAGYGAHRLTGNLQKGLKIATVNKGQYGTGRVLKSTAPHAWIFENGTQARHTSLGANRGSMPPGHVFIPAVIRARRWLYEQVKDLLRRKGAVVTGEAA